MKKTAFTLLIILFAAPFIFSQKVTGKLSFQQGQTMSINISVKSTVTQEAMGNAFDIIVDGSATHAYKITNATDDNTTLHHEVNRVTFNFDGMGSKRSFDSDNKKDMEGMFGPPVKDVLSKTYDMIIDPAGKVLLVKPEKIELAKGDDRLAIVFTMLKDITGVVYPPKKNESSIFKILPDTATGLNSSWTEAGADASGKFNTTYTLSAITDSTLVIDLKGTSVTSTKSEMMGMQISTNLNNTYEGKITLDKLTGILKEKSVTTTSTGTTEAMGNKTPVTSKTTIVVKVYPQSAEK